MKRRGLTPEDFLAGKGDFGSEDGEDELDYDEEDAGGQDDDDEDADYGEDDSEDYKPNDKRPRKN